MQNIHELTTIVVAIIVLKMAAIKKMVNTIYKTK